MSQEEEEDSEVIEEIIEIIEEDSGDEKERSGNEKQSPVSLIVSPQMELLKVSILYLLLMIDVIDFFFFFLKGKKGSAVLSISSEDMEKYGVEHLLMEMMEQCEAAEEKDIEE
jgi:hypothetical protein